MKRKSALAATALLMTLAFVLSAAGSISAANVVATVSVGTTPMSVAYNPTTNKIYVTNDGDSTLSVINGITDTVTSVSINSGNHSVAANPTTNKIYVANEAGNNVTVLDGTTDTVVGSPITVGSSPVAIAVNPTTNRVYVANEQDNNVSVINGATDTVIGSRKGAIRGNITALEAVYEEYRLGGKKDAEVGCCILDHRDSSGGPRFRRTLWRGGYDRRDTVCRVPDSPDCLVYLRMERAARRLTIGKSGL